MENRFSSGQDRDRRRRSALRLVGARARPAKAFTGHRLGSKARPRHARGVVLAFTVARDGVPPAVEAAPTPIGLGRPDPPSAA
jgi:hypothetical protein